MTIRIDSIERREHGERYVWRIRMKGLHGAGVYCDLETGVDGRGLYYSAMDVPRTELLPPARFHAHPGLNAEQVAHRVAAVLVAIGWGGEFYDDRDSITTGRPIATRIQQVGAHAFDALYARDRVEVTGQHETAAAVGETPPAPCQCSACREHRFQDGERVEIRMVLCPTCGNKRCPHATDHRLVCTHSNDLGQWGSSYGDRVGILDAAPVTPDATSVLPDA